MCWSQEHLSQEQKAIYREATLASCELVACFTTWRPPKPTGEVAVVRMAWLSPVVFVTKKDGSTRFCVDYWILNDITQKDSYPLPSENDMLDTLAGARCIGLRRSGYWQVQSSDDADEKNYFFNGD